MKKLTAIRGMSDILPKDSALWLFVEKTLIDLFIAYGYQNIRTPIVEKTDIFRRTIGQATDIIEKEMYSWTDKNGEELSLRPEATAGCVRAMIEHNLPREGIQKVFYHGQMFRHERPQKGRYRQFHQAGVEVFGAKNAKIDAELIAMSAELWRLLGLKNLTLEINTLGSAASKKRYQSILIDYFAAHKNELDENSLKRLKTNPLRILDSKNKDMQKLIKQAPKITQYLDEDSSQHFELFKKYLNYLKIDYIVNPHLMRGLDYYNRSVFEWKTNDLGTQDAICAGGRYDNLLEKMGGKSTPAVGFALGIERLILLLKEKKSQLSKPSLSLYFIASEDSDSDKTQLKSMQICQHLRATLTGIILYNDIGLGSLKSQFKRADKVGADYALILAETELKADKISIKPLKKQGKQETMDLTQIINYLQEKR